MVVNQAGFPALALMGSSLSEQQTELLASHFRHVVVVLDGDEAGRKGTEELPGQARPPGLCAGGGTAGGAGAGWDAAGGDSQGAQILRASKSPSVKSWRAVFFEVKEADLRLCQRGAACVCQQIIEGFTQELLDRGVFLKSELP